MMMLAIIALALTCVTMLVLALPFRWASSQSFGTIWVTASLGMMFAGGIYLAGWVLIPHCAPDMIQRLLNPAHLLEACRSDDSIGVMMIQLPAIAVVFSTMITTALAAYRRTNLVKTPKGAN